MTKALVQAALGSEQTGHQSYGKHDTGEKAGTNRRNGSNPKTLRSDQGPLEIEVSRDREGEFEPKLVGKHQRELPGFSGPARESNPNSLPAKEVCSPLHQQPIVGRDGFEPPARCVSGMGCIFFWLIAGAALGVFLQTTD